MTNTLKGRIEATRAVTLGVGHFSTPEPQIEVTIPSDTHFRVLKAELHRLAAEAELATPADQDWLVQTEVISDRRGRVYLELIEGRGAEVEAGMKLLRSLRG